MSITTRDDIFDGLFNMMKPRLRDLYKELGAVVNLPSVPLDADDDKYTVEFEVPGMSKDNLHVEVKGQLIVVSGECKRGTSFRTTNQSRTLPKDADLDTGIVGATLDDGILRVTVMRTKPRSRKITIT